MLNNIILTIIFEKLDTQSLFTINQLCKHFYILTIDKCDKIMQNLYFCNCYEKLNNIILTIIFEKLDTKSLFTINQICKYFYILTTDQCYKIKRQIQYQYTQPHYTNVNIGGINMSSFGLYPEQYEPSGSINFSKLININF